MDSFDGISVFGYDVNSSNMGNSDSSGVLEIYVHHARNIHNICIYENQDVYAKFSLTYNPDQTLSTRIINGGGKNPDFNENLRMKVTQLDSVLKCEIWMLSRARNYLEDQLLGFALVPLSRVVGKGKVTENYSLSSTDLFHSPAGTVQLSLSLDKSLPVDVLNSVSDLPVSSSISSEVVLLDRKISEVMLDSAEYSRIEFPDVNVVMENQQMVSEYFALARNDSCTRPGIATFLHLGASPPQPPYDFEMTANSTEEHQPGSISPNDSSIQNSSFLSSTTTSSSDDRNSVDSAEKKIRFSGQSSNSVNASVTTIDARNQVSGPCPDTPTSRKSGRAAEDKESKFSNKKDKISIKKEGSIPSVKFDHLFSAPLGNINLDAEQSAMQQQIVDMYMKSMHQFTESLAKMKLPMDLDKPEHEHRGVVLQTHDPKPEINQNKKDGSRVFYGSRAFF
uniref:C2 domain-containing protein n=1 Tax=Cucumis melo TaxID=3656 RepID=A0A9I9D9E3_CUCME